MSNLAPGIINQELVTIGGPIQPDDPSVAAFMGVAEWGPLGTPTLVRSFPEFVEKFGSYRSDSDLAYAVESFFECGGKKAYISRLAEYSDITDATTHPGVAASTTLDDSATVPASTLTLSSKYVGTYGNDIEVEIVKNPKVNQYLLAADIVGPFTSLNLLSKTNITPGQILKIEQGEDAFDLNSAGRLANLIAFSFNNHIADNTIHLVADAVNAVVAPAATNLSTLITLVNAIDTAYAAHREEAGVHTVDDTTNIVFSPTATDLATAITLVNDIKTQYLAHLADTSSHSSADTVNVLAASAYARVISVETTFPGGIATHDVTVDDGAGGSVTVDGLGSFSLLGASAESTEFDVKVYYDGATTPTETFSQVTMKDDMDNYVETVINAEPGVGGSVYISATDLDSASGIGKDRPAPVSKTSLTGGVAEITSGLTVTDLVGSSISSLGLNAFDGREDVRILAAIRGGAGASGYSQYSAEFITSALSYCESRKDLFFLCGFDDDDTASQVVTERNNGGYNSSYGAMYGPRVSVLDKMPGATSTTKYICPLGSIAGKMALVDNLPSPDGGPWNAAAGLAPYGNIVNAQGVAKSYSVQDRADLNSAGVNIIRDRASKGIIIYGVRTLYTELDFRYINVRRLFQYVQLSVANSVEGNLFRNNTPRTWTRLRAKLNEFLTELYQDGGLYGNSTSEAFFVKVGESDGVQTPVDTANGRLIAEVGINPPVPGEFLIFRYSQFDGGATIE